MLAYNISMLFADKLKTRTTNLQYHTKENNDKQIQRMDLRLRVLWLAESDQGLNIIYLANYQIFMGKSTAALK